jgi:hypothetical protein
VPTHLVEDPRAEDRLKEVVDYKHVTEVKRFPVLHHLGAQHFGEVRIRQADRKSWEGAAHHGPVVHTRICGNE